MPIHFLSRTLDGAHVRSIFWDAVAGEQRFFKTYDLIALFGIPVGKILGHIMLSYRTNTPDVNMSMTIDPRLKKPQALETGDADTGIDGAFEVAAEIANRQYHYPLHGIRNFDEMHLTSNQTTHWHLNFWHMLLDGDMRTIDDDGLRVGDIVQVTPDRTPGEELFQLGPLTQIGQPGEDIP